MQDLLDLFPVSYKDYTQFHTLAAADSEPRLYRVVLRRPPRGSWWRGRHVLTLEIGDEDGGQNATVRIFNQPYLQKALAQATFLYIDGTARRVRGKLVFSAPSVLLKLPETGIMPVYRRVDGLSPARLRKAAEAAARAVRIDDPCSDAFLERYQLLPLGDAYRAVHAPRTMAEQELGRRRFAFESGLLTVRSLDAVAMESSGPNDKIIAAHDYIRSFEKWLPFEPTGAQRRVMQEIAADLEGESLMNRLVEGDVGSGKTVVALFAMFAAAEEGYQSFLLAPTEVLASQHAQAVSAVLGDEETVLITGSMSAAERREAEQRVRSGEAYYIVGTHALLFSDLRPPRPGLLVADEQHRFGVRQRQALLSQVGPMHSLVMSATPIPRSLALALGGMSRISVLDELPSGREPVRTRFVSGDKTDSMYDFLAGKARAGEQAYVVCPLVETNPDLNLHSAADVCARLSRKYPDVGVGLLHGRLSAAEKEQVLERFHAGEISILVATTVIEVGIDEPNATVIVIHDADRFGLAQLHQLRGRVGRGSKASWCFMTSESAAARSRLRTVAKTTNGFEIAEADLRERGVGEVLGLRQHGREAGLLDIRDSAMIEVYRETLDEMARDPRLREDYLRIAALAQARVDAQLRDVALN